MPPRRIQTPVWGTPGLRDILVMGRDSPENSHPKQETVFHISSPYSHSWKGKNKKQKTKQAILESHWQFPSYEMEQRKRCVQRKAKAYSTTHVLHLHTREGNTCHVSESSPRRQGKQGTRAQLILWKDLTCFCGTFTSTLTPAVSAYTPPSLSEVPLAPRDIQFIWSLLTWLWQFIRKITTLDQIL